MPIELDTDAAFAIENGFRITNPKIMLDWYCDVIGFEPFGEIFVSGGHVWGLRFGNSILKFLHYIGAENTGADARLNSHYITIHVTNAQEMLERCQRAGANILAGYNRFTPSRAGDPECDYVLVFDPEGNVVEFSQGSPWVAPTANFRPA
jgi:catechol 2,3-dioxygenase-like lactoylglutathione lyase family enzyme